MKTMRPLIKSRWYGITIWKVSHDLNVQWDLAPTV